MSHLTNPKSITLQLVVNEARDTVELFETIAEVLHVAIGEQDQLEYVQLKNITHEEENI